MTNVPIRASSFLRHSSFENSSFAWEVGEDDRHDKNVHERDFEKEAPAEPHQLVVTESRQGPANPDKNKKKRNDLGEKDKHIDQTPAPAVRTVGHTGEVPASKEQGDDDRTAR